MEYLPAALYRADQTRAADQRAAGEHGLAGGVLMQRAAAAALAVARERFPRTRRLALLCGPGNNGGDGYVMARLARAAGLTAVVICPDPDVTLRGDALAARQDWLAADGRVQAFDPTVLRSCDLLVDALFGTGLERPLDGPWRAAVQAMRAAGRPVLALDVPSGLHSDTGRVLGTAVRADVTLSFIGLKAGLFTAQGREHSGLILFDDLGVPAHVFDGQSPQAVRTTPATLRGLLKPRARHVHKGDAGRVLIIGGQAGMPGAVRLAGEAAYRAGAGLVLVATQPEHAAGISHACPEIISHGVSDAESLQALVQSVHALAIGPGLGRGAWGAALWQAACACPRRLVVDAEALRFLAAAPAARSDWVLTPHPGEAAQLLGCPIADIEADRFHAVRELARRYGGVCVLKGSGTLIAAGESGQIELCDRGTPALASGGTGDVLTGVITALLAQGLAPWDAARAGVWAHAVAGEAAAACGERGLLARDLLMPLRTVVNGLAYAD